MIAAVPGNVDAALLGVLVQRRGGDAEKLEKARGDMQNAVAQIVQTLHKQLNGEAASAEEASAAATQASPAPVDVAGDVKQLVETNNAQLKVGYASMLANVAWAELYFGGRSTEVEPYLQLLRQLVPADSTVLTRLEGWQFLNAGRIDEAKSKLSAAAERDDALARLGLLLIDEKDPAKQPQVKADALKLFQANSSGLVGAILADALRDKITPGPGLPIPAPQSSDKVRGLVEDFPRDWLDFISKPASFYILKVDPLKVNHQYGEPMLAQVLIKNISTYDLTIGTGGALRQDLWFDLQIRGLVQQGLLGVTFERIQQRVVLKPQEILTQIVRVDQGQLSGLLQSNPSVAIPLYFSMFTNPITIQTGISPGPGGQRVQFGKPVMRVASPLNSEQAVDELIAKVAAGGPDGKMLTLELLSAYARVFTAQPDEKVKAKGLDMVATLRRASTKDPVAAVRAGLLTHSRRPPTPPTSARRCSSRCSAATTGPSACLASR